MLPTKKWTLAMKLFSATSSTRNLMLSAIVLAGMAVLATFVIRSPAQAGSRVEVNGTVTATSMRTELAIQDAAERLGYPVRQPEVPPGWKITVIRTEVGPAGPDQDGNIRDLGWVKLATLVLRSSDERFLELGQLPPDKPIRLPAGVQPRRVEAGVAGVVASVAQTPGKTTLVWDSEEASYSASYVYPDESYAADAEAFLVGLLKSMK